MMDRLTRVLTLTCLIIIIVLLWSGLAQSKVDEQLQRAILAAQQSQEASRREIVKGQLEQLRALGVELKAVQSRSDSQSAELMLLESHVASLELTNKLQAKLIYNLLPPSVKGATNVRLSPSHP